MKWFIALSSFAGAAIAQDCASVALSAIPACAQSCFLNAAPSVGCAALDFACQCDNQAALFAAAESCVASACEESSYQPVIDGASAVCNCARGVIVVPAATTTDAAMGVVVRAATTMAPAQGSNTAGISYSSPQSLTPTATNAAPTKRAALGVMGGAAMAAMWAT